MSERLMMDQCHSLSTVLVSNKPCSLSATQGVSVGGMKGQERSGDRK